MGNTPDKQQPDTEVDLYEAASAMSATTRTSDTPTHSTVTEEPPSYTPTETVPWPGETFVIREPNQGLAITLTEGRLRLRQEMGNRGGCHWVCVDRNGWLGFRNAVSGTYLGHDQKGNFYAKVQHHEPHEYFCARRHPRGGYILLMRHGNDLQKMAIGEDGESLVETKGEGTAWEFFKT